MFVGREQELASLEEFYAKDGIGMTLCVRIVVSER